jgi:hypothetical protein
VTTLVLVSSFGNEYSPEMLEHVLAMKPKIPKATGIALIALFLAPCYQPYNYFFLMITVK